MLSSSAHPGQEATQPNGRRSSLQARKQELVRNTIWDAAIDLFAKQGFDETTVDEIVEAAGVSRRSFFRYFSSKNDLMTQRGTASYQTLVTEAIHSCPPSYSISEVVRHTVLEVARHSAAEPRTRKVIEVAKKYASAREALSHVSSYSVTEAFARRRGKNPLEDWTADLLAGLTYAVINAVGHSWFENPKKDISITVDQVFATLDRLVCEGKNPVEKNHSESAASNRKPKRSPH